MTEPPPERAADFIASVGVNIHLSQDAITAKAVIADMAYLGPTNAILADPGPAARTFTPTPLNDTIIGLPGDGARRVVETSSGTCDIVVWAEPRIWNAATAIAAATATVTVDLGAPFDQVRVFDPLVWASPISTASGAVSHDLRRRAPPRRAGRAGRGRGLINPRAARRGGRLRGEI